MEISMYLVKIFAIRTIWRCILYAVVPALIFYVLSVAGLLAAGFELLQILRDPAQQTDQSSFLGFVSNIGIWLWVSSVAICFFSVAAGDSIAENSQKELLILVGMLSLLLAVDDFFLIHDRYINEYLCFTFYAILAGALLARHYDNIFKIDGFAFLLAGLLLALSILTDMMQFRILNRTPMDYTHVQAIEEAFKFTGAAAWLYFSCRMASLHLNRSMVRDQNK